MKNIKTSLISFFVIISMLLTTVVPAFAAENAALEDEFLSQTDFDLSEEAIEEIDKAAKEVGVNFIGGFSALVQKGMTEGDKKLIASIPACQCEIS